MSGPETIARPIELRKSGWNKPKNVQVAVMIIQLIHLLNLRRDIATKVAALEAEAKEQPDPTAAAHYLALASLGANLERPD